MKKTMVLGIGIALISILTIASLAMARGGGLQQTGTWERGQFRSQECPAVSSLTEEQQQELFQMAQEHRDWMYPKKQQVIARQAELNALLATEGTDQAKILQTREELSGLNQEIFERKLDHRIKMSQEYNINPRMKGQTRGNKRYSESGRTPRQGSPRSSR